MLDADTKRRIDTARDILVGKVPDPKSQVEQITIALIYKFMDDIDAESEELGGQRQFFAGDFARYGWPQLVRAGLGGHQVLNLYAEAITRMPENPGIPALFRDIFNNAYLPYRDPETLRAFLKVIDTFTYDHSERLGDAFEYLLSVLGSQGDAGQFRTPRHIIDFMVAILDPKKDETVLDPACGTAGFLVSSYKHVLKANTDADGHSTLTPDDKGKLAANFKGYDISPDMVRLSLVNLYLHGFVEPHVVEYDTLTSEERWNEYADVILANPPFMSPKGGIRPHRRFSVQSKRSEVLFVDYMAEHLTPTGRAGIIVPEGIVFQSQTAHKQLRKMLVQNYLVAVISLPSGVFQPYSGVKTSILILDKTLAKKTDRITFFKVENDGFDLGAQRRAIVENDLPQVTQAVKEYLNMDAQDRQDKEKASCPSCSSMLQHLISQGTALIAEKGKIAANGEYNLSGERYRRTKARDSHYAMVPFKSVCTLEYGSSLPKKKRADGPYPVMGSNGISGYHDEYLIEGPAIIVGRKGSAGEVVFVETNCFPIDTTYYVKLKDPEHTDIIYFYHLLKTLDLPSLREGAGIPGLNRNDVYEKYRLPMPPLEVQREIVAEIEGYQRVIDGARAVIDSYRPHIVVDPEWPMVELGELTKTEYGFTAKANDSGDTRLVRITDIAEDGTLRKQTPKFVTLTNEMRESLLAKGDILVARTGATYGKTLLFEEDFPAIFASYLIRLRFSPDVVHPRYYWVFAQSDAYWNQAKALVTGGGQPQFNGNVLRRISVPLPPIAQQQTIVAEVEVEQVLVDANRKLIERFEKKIQTVIASVWNETSS